MGLLEACTLPLTGRQCVHHVLTDLGWFDVISDGQGGKKLLLREIAPGETVETIRAKTEAAFDVHPEIATIGL